MSIRAGTSWLRAQLRAMPVVLAAMLIGSVLFGALGCAAGLVVGLSVYPPTAWFAVFELSVPAAMVGCFVGVFAGLIAQWLGATPTSWPPSKPVDDDFAGTPPGW